MHGCGQCFPCRFNRRRLWTHRMLLESLKHGDSSFVTLTYSEEKLPDDKSLNPKHAQDWLKRLRRNISPTSIRYFLVGEYGDRTQRPHYHAALFGIGVQQEALINETWGNGYTLTGDLTKDSAGYIAGYVTKKMTSKDDPRLNGRHPEFARMSLKPGIGATALQEIQDTLTTTHGCDHFAMEGDVPMALQTGKKKLPLGRYLRRKLREKMGFKQEDIDKTVQKYTQEMHLLLQEAITKKENDQSPIEYFLDSNKQKILNLETRSKITKGKIL